MIQRIQSVWLFAAAALLSGLFLVPDQLVRLVFSPESGVNPQNFMTSNLASSLLLGLAAVVGFGSIFLFKNRPQQLRLVRLAMIDVLLFGISAAVFFWKNHQSAPDSHFEYGWAIALPVAALVCLWMAMRGIRADEALVKSADRLR